MRQTIQSMEKEQSKGIILHTEIKKDKISHYPYHLVTSIHSPDQDVTFLVVIDYTQDNTILAIYPFAKDMSRMPMCGITLNSILGNKAICTLNVLSMKYKNTQNGVTILRAQFVLGCRSGHLVLVEYNGKDCKIVAKLNKAIKSEGILSKTSSFFFGEEDSYTLYKKQAVKQFRKLPYHHQFQYSYQLGNNLIFLKSINEGLQKSLFESLQANTSESFALHYDYNLPGQKGSLMLYGCDDYYGVKDRIKKTGIIEFNHEVSSYQFLSAQSQQIAVSLSTKEMILLIDLDKFALKAKIHTQVSLRTLSYFKYRQEEYLAIMVHDNYVILYELNQQKYCKLTGHRSFIANVGYDRKEEMLVTGGMDHRISLVKMPQIPPNKWTVALNNGKLIELQDNNNQNVRFHDIFSLGQYNNVRTNLHSYGFGDFKMINGFYCLPTFDSKVMIYKYA